MRYKPYPKYKESGVAWLGEVPEGWEVLKTKYCFRLIVEPAPKNNNYELLSIYTDIGVKPRKDLEAKGNKATTTDGYWIVQKGDLIVNKLLAWMGAIGYSHYNGVTSPAYDILRSNKNISSRFYSYLFRTKIAQQEFKRWSRGIMEMRLRLYFSEFGNILLPVPALEEQIKIVNYIEEKTKKIDTLIKKQQTLIELLKEKRQALISHVVTKGLDDSVAMKESGVEWLGEVPEGWKVLPLKYITTNNDDVLSDNTDKNYEFNYVDIGSVDASIGIVKYEKLIYANAPSRARRKVKSGDIIVSTVRTYLRAIASIEDKKDDLIVSTGFAVIRPKERFNSKFASYLLKSNYFVETVVAKSVGISYPAINSSELVTIKIILPPLKDQQKIANHLDQKTKQIDTLIEKSTKAIELLKERREALISAVVTGKVDVRDFDEGEKNEL